MTGVRISAEDTNARYDAPGGTWGEDCALVLSDGTDAAVLTGSVSSLLMLVDRINDRVHAVRSRGAREFAVGDRVIYVAYEGAEPEAGVVTSLSNDPSLVFVRYAKYRSQSASPPQATPKVRLRHA